MSRRDFDLDRYLMNNPIREILQQRFVGAYFSKVARPLSEPFCLEIGCGRGAGARIIIETFQASKVIGFDVDEGQVKLAKCYLRSRQLKDKVGLFIGDAERLSFPDSTFDAVFDFGVLHHLPNWRAALREVARVLKPNGQFFFEEPLKPILDFVLLRSILNHPKDGLFTACEFSQALKKARFTISDLKEVDGIFIRGMAYTSDPVAPLAS